MRNYRNIYSKLIRLGKEMTPEGANARNKAILVKDKKLDNADHRKTRKRNPGYNKGSWNDTDGENLDKIIRDMYNYNYHYVPIKKLPKPESPKMFAEYIPTNPPCPSCPSFDGFPELKKSTGISWECWRCGGKFTKGSDGKFRKIIEGGKLQDSSEGENPGDYQTHAGQRIWGKSGPPGVPTPTRPAKPTTNPNQPVPKPLPGQGPTRGSTGGGGNQPKGTPGKPRVVS